MQLTADQIPKSLQSYVEQFESSPDEAIERLETHILRRNSGAVGYFVLSWLYHRNNQQQHAIQAALRAKMYAPGSKLMERLHYVMTHPQRFEAWTPESKRESFKRSNQNDRGHPIQDLDSLIAKLSSVEKTRIKPNLSDNSDVPDLSEASNQVDDIVTETLAAIHEKQGDYKGAINTYKKLRRINSSKKETYDEQIFRLQQLIAEEKKKNKDSTS
jgi:tetratricopeptide (TPR) repeat protein